MATRTTSFELYAPLLQPLGFQAALEALAERTTRQAGLQLELAYAAPALPLADAVLGVLLRVVRELLANVRKHASATIVRLSVSQVGRDLQIELHDNGRGLPTDSSPRGFGLSSAEAQMQALGGRLELTSRPGRGTTARLRLPIRDST
jgi:signal transduction histidine kinase